jgi:hypothetical protein
VVEQDVGCMVVFTRLDGRADGDVGVDGVVALLLQRVGADLGNEPDPTAFVVGQIDQDTQRTIDDLFQRRLELRVAVAFERVKDIAGDATRVDTDERGPAVAWSALLIRTNA